MSSDVAFLATAAAGYRVSQILYAFAALGIADALAAGPRSVADLAASSAADESALRRLLCACAALGLIEELPDGGFRLCGRGALLRRDADGSLRPRALSVGQPEQWQSWGELLRVVRTGTPAFATPSGSTSFDYFDRTPGAGITSFRRLLDTRRHYPETG